MSENYNMRSLAVRRLKQEAKEMREPTELYSAQPLKGNLFEWHFTIAGPKETDFEGGYYHGRLIFPSRYPMEPWSISMLTPNGRFDVYQKPCLSPSAHNPELWYPACSVRTLLLAIISSMSEEDVHGGEFMDCSPEERRRMARRSPDWVCPQCGIANRDHFAIPARPDRVADGRTEIKDNVMSLILDVILDVMSLILSLPILIIIYLAATGSPGKLSGNSQVPTGLTNTTAGTGMY